MEAITSGSTLAVSDGSFQNHCGSCAWIIEGNQSEDQIEGSMLTPGCPGDHSSFQSEAAGVYSILLTMWYFLKDYLMSGVLMVACDGRLAFDRLQSKKSIDPFAACADLLWACKNIQEQMACKIKFLHIKGHQDNGHPMVLLREALLNIESNLAVKSHICNSPPENFYQSLPYEPWCLLINNAKIVKYHQCAIQEAMNRLAAKQYWTTKMPEVPQLHI